MVLTALIRSKARTRILTLLLLGNQEKYYLREIERRTGENINSVRRELANLESAGFVVSSALANLKYFSINRSSSIYPELRSMFLKTEGVAGVVRERLARHGDIESAFIFGSFASGEETVTSDIDLFLVGMIEEKAVIRTVREMEQLLGRQVNFVTMSREEFERRAKTRDPFVSRVLSSPLVPLVGEGLSGPGRNGAKRRTETVQSKRK